jgi:hypothetical protein
VTIIPAPKDTDEDGPAHSIDARPRGRIGWIVAGSLVTELLAALLLVLVPFVPARESSITGAVLCGFALGWAMLAVLSIRLTDSATAVGCDSRSVHGTGWSSATLASLADKPLVVLSAGSGSAADWPAKQSAMATLSTNSAHRVIDGATHASLISNEKDAAKTTQAILDVVTSVRSSAPLVR